MKLILPKRSSLAAPYVKRRLIAEKYRTIDTSFTFRMGAGVAGDVNRGHPASIQPCLMDPSNPVTSYGQAVVASAAGAGVRPIGVGDGAITEIWGVVCRPYPIQQPTTANQYGAVPYGDGVVPTQQPVDVLRGGYIMVSVGTQYGSPVKGGPVFIYVAASGGGHILGQFEGATGANVITLDATDYYWNGPPDSNGIAELVCNKF